MAISARFLPFTPVEGTAIVEASAPVATAASVGKVLSLIVGFGVAYLVPTNTKSMPPRFSYVLKAGAAFFGAYGAILLDKVEEAARNIAMLTKLKELRPELGDRDTTEAIDSAWRASLSKKSGAAIKDMRDLTQADIDRVLEVFTYKDRKATYYVEITKEGVRDYSPALTKILPLIFERCPKLKHDREQAVRLMQHFVEVRIYYPGRAHQR